MNSVINSDGRGRKRVDGYAVRAPSFSKLRPDGKLEIGGRVFKNQYNYVKYRGCVNYVGPKGEQLIEGVDFFLDDEGVVRSL